MLIAGANHFDLMFEDQRLRLLTSSLLFTSFGLADFHKWRKKQNFWEFRDVSFLLCDKLFLHIFALKEKRSEQNETCFNGLQ